MSEARGNGSKLVRATVLVRPKQGILDPQGQAVQSSLEKLGFPVEAVRVGRVIDLEVEAKDEDDARNQIALMCDTLLANPLIESFDVRLAE
ncbi:MAG TPA: phosphoribosylformylglycinamidine synthase subunit PurS [Gaiellaceae bacterium]|nr:phosphoribosylformylglycinamidine synthase subunit PurS [Gaiellaceae bacterium]